MRSILLTLGAMYIATAAFADDPTLMLRKSGNCSGVVTAVDRDTRQTLASCGFGCTEASAQVPVGTRISVTTQAYGACNGGVDYQHSSSLIASRTREFRMNASGVVISARFRMTSTIAIGVGNRTH